MHILIGALGAIVTILILLNRLSENGVDIGWLNPFAWKRRREWDKRYHANPVYSLTSPMDVTALIMVAIVKSEGEISAEQKQEIKHKFREVFHLGDEQASALLASSSFLLKDEAQAIKSMSKLLEPSINHFTEERAASALNLVTHIANFDSPASPFQQEVISALKGVFLARYASFAEWM